MERFINANCSTVIPCFNLYSGTSGYRIENQWEGNGLRNVYVVDMNDGSRELIKDKVRGGVYISPGGDYTLWYDWKERNWSGYQIAGGTIADVTKGIDVPLSDEEDDHPDDAPPHGYIGWLKEMPKSTSMTNMISGNATLRVNCRRSALSMA